MAVLGSMTKQPNEILDFDIDYTAVLAGRTDTLTTPSVTITPSTGTPVTAPTPTISGNKVKVVVSAGTDAVTYKVTVTVNTTPAGLRYEDEVNIVVQET